MKDKNYIDITVGATVDVPPPNSEDNYNNEFRGTVKEFVEGEYVVVEDMDGDCFCIEAERLEVVDEETEEKTNQEAIDKFLGKK